MAMTLEEAIDHAIEVSKKKTACEECREEHAQLAKWLEELKDYRKNKPMKALSYADTHIDMSALEETRGSGAFPVVQRIVDRNGKVHWKTGWYKNRQKKVDDFRNVLHGEGD